MHDTQQAWASFVRRKEIAANMRKVLTEKNQRTRLTAYPKTFERKASQ